MKVGLDANQHLEQEVAGDLKRSAINRRGSMFDSSDVENVEKYQGDNLASLNEHQ